MNIMKKIIKSRMFAFVIGALLFSSISVYAARKYYANQVDYEPSNPNFNVNNMADALDQLYTTQNTTVNNLNSQITTKDQTISSLNGQISSKDATISSLTSQINELNASSCFKGTITLNQSATTSSGQTVLNFAPSVIYWDYGDMSYAVIYSNGANKSPTVYIVNFRDSSNSEGYPARANEGPYTFSEMLITSNSVKLMNYPSSYIGSSSNIVACR